MGIFRDEYGDIIAWRVVIVAIVAVALAAGIALAVFWPKPQEKGSDETTPAQTVATPSEARDPKADYREWLAGVEGSDRLAGMGDATLEGLRLVIVAWEKSALGGVDGVTLAVVGEPVHDGSTATVRLRVRHGGGETWAEATLAGGAWSVEERPDGFPDIDRIPTSDVVALSALMPEGVASEVSRQVAASGIDGAGEAWTVPTSVRTEGQVTRLSVWFPRAGGDSVEWTASFDESFGMLEVAPAAETREEAVR